MRSRGIRLPRWSRRICRFSTSYSNSKRRKRPPNSAPSHHPRPSASASVDAEGRGGEAQFLVEVTNHRNGNRSNGARPSTTFGYEPQKPRHQLPLTPTQYGSSGSELATDPAPVGCGWSEFTDRTRTVPAGTLLAHRRCPHGDEVVTQALPLATHVAYDTGPSAVG